MFIKCSGLCDQSFHGPVWAKNVYSVIKNNDPAIIYDSEGGVYPADIMALAVLLNSD